MNDLLLALVVFCCLPGKFVFLNINVLGYPHFFLAKPKKLIEIFRILKSLFKISNFLV